MTAIVNVEDYEWMVYLFDGITLIFVGLFLIGTLIGSTNDDRTLPTMIASLACIVMSIYFFAEAIFTRNKKKFNFSP
ncbi:hypothetical protein [Methanospirillum sp.]|uniref:hypothetical protein n=1 Tax=Methanospirillum sp. TaxID=45200 RepID=UPI002985A942|nr:hypothetical protein [Methanospirillum sp.]